MLSDNLLGKYLKTLRKSLHYTQEFIASELDISRQAYSHYETGRVIPPNDICIRLARLYHIKPEKILHLSLAASKSECISTNCPEDIADFIDYFEQESIEKKTHLLTAQERELLFYFSFLSDEDQQDIMEFMKIRAKRTKQQNKKTISDNKE